MISDNAVLPDEKSIPTIQTIVGRAAKGSIIHKQIQEFSTLSTVASCANSNSSVVQVNLSPSCCSSHSTPSTQGQKQAQSNFNYETPNPSFSHEQKDSNVPGTSDLQASPNAQSTGEPHVQTSSVPKKSYVQLLEQLVPPLLKYNNKQCNQKDLLQHLQMSKRKLKRKQ